MCKPFGGNSINLRQWPAIRDSGGIYVECEDPHRLHLVHSLKDGLSGAARQ